MKWLGASAEYVMDHPVGAVWAFVSNVENFGKWAEGVEEPRWTSGGERGVGSTYESKYVYVGKTHEIEYEVTGHSTRPQNSLPARPRDGSPIEAA